MKVLLVDDHEIVRRGLKQILAEELPVTHFGEASGSAAALDLLLRESWDVVLLDINIPGRSGLDVLEEIQRSRPGTPVLMLSIYPEAEYAMRALKLGAAGYLTKDQASEELVAAVRKARAGGRYVTASLAERLAAAVGGELDPSPHEALSSRELQVLRLVAEGKTLKEIATALSLSDKTIATYRQRISQKLGLTTGNEITRYAMRHRLIDG